MKALINLVGLVLLLGIVVYLLKPSPEVNHHEASPTPQSREDASSDNPKPTAHPPTKGLHPFGTPSPRLTLTPEEAKVMTEHPAGVLTLPIPKGSMPPTHLLALVGQGKWDYLRRYRACQKLSHRLGREEVDLLIDYLRTPPSPSMNLGEELSIKNEILTSLLSQDQLRDELETFLILESHNPSQPELWRDYVLQHIPMYLERLNRDGNLSHRTLSVFRSHYGESLSESRGRLAGTALIGIHRNHQAGVPLFKAPDIKLLARKTYRNTSHAQATRLSALQVLIEHKDPLVKNLDVEKMIWDYRDDAENLPLLISAISGWGYLGGNKERASLAKHHRLESNPLIKKNLEVALATMSERGIR